MASLIWWGYIHVNGSIHVKRYFDERDIDDAIESPFIEEVMPPFGADGRSDAMHQAAKHFGVREE